MQSYLMSQGTWRVLKKLKPTAPVKKGKKVASTSAPKDGAEEITAVDEDDYEDKFLDYEDKLEKWEEDNSKAVGGMRLRLHHTIQYKY
jgi:hypothetical protein